MLTDAVIAGAKVRLREKTMADAPDDYAWQSDHDLSSLDAVPRLTLPFPQYLSVYAGELGAESPSRREFAIDTLDGRHIGNCTYYGINNFRGETELGIMIGNTDYWDKGYGVDTVTALVNYIFSRLNFKRIHLKTLESNRRAQRCFQKCGFAPYGRRSRNGFDFTLMEITRQQWESRSRPRQTDDKITTGGAG